MKGLEFMKENCTSILDKGFEKRSQICHKCNIVEYNKLTDKLFYGVLLTENHLNNAMETIKNYLFEGGEGYILNYLGICYRTVERISSVNPEDNEVIKKCFVYFRGDRKGEELTLREVENIGFFLIGGGWYDEYYKYKKERWEKYGVMEVC